jgi:hypothetical protein
MQALTGAELEGMLTAFVTQVAASEADAIAALKQQLHARVMSAMDVEVVLWAVADVMDVEPEDVAIELDLRRFRQGNALVPE